jgi:L-seryl-tRNA(Ser) seleniumtransferase
MDPSSEVKADPRRALPAVDRVVEALSPQQGLPAWAAIEASRIALAEARESLATAPESLPAVESQLLQALALRAGEIARLLCASSPRRVINATGIPLHTNLGRAPLAPGAVAAIAAVAGSYGDLELDLSTGRRGDRQAAIREKLMLLSEAPAALAVNNNAAALMLALDTLARGREAIVSRGELVEIGGSFRVPDIMERAGVDLVEVGTTNRTHLEDYERAIGPRTALLLKVHRSNFELKGFVAEASLSELSALARRRALPLVEDLGSATLVDLTSRGIPPEAFAPGRLKLGADVVCFSGDKLLGGPQAGIALGTSEIVEAMRRNPLARALRLDKLSLAALDWTLSCYLDGRAESEIPVLRQLLEPPSQLEARARALAARLRKVCGDGVGVEARPDGAFVGGGSLPGFQLQGWVVDVRPETGAERFAKRLRGAPVPVIARLRDEALVLDVRTLLEGDEDALEAAFVQALADARVERDGSFS